MRLALLHTRIRAEERMLIDALHARGVEPEIVDVRSETLDLASGDRWRGIDVALDRCVSLSASLAATRVLERHGVRTINRSGAIAACADKLATTCLLESAGVPSPSSIVATGAEAALDAVEAIGYPAVIKPTVGSWGRLVCRVNDRDAAEAVVEHRATLGGPAQGAFYVQQHIDKPGRDLRVFVAGGVAIACIARSADHWVTNTARGATVEGIDLSAEMRSLAERAADAVGADLTAVDLLECPDRGLLVNELNHSMEFRNSVDPTGVDIPGRIADVALNAARREEVAA